MKVIMQYDDDTIKSAIESIIKAIYTREENGRVSEGRKAVDILIEKSKIRIKWRVEENEEI